MSISLEEIKHNHIINYDTDIMNMCEDISNKLSQSFIQDEKNANHINYELLVKILYECYEDSENIKKIQNKGEDYYNLTNNDNIFHPINLLRNNNTNFQELTQLFILSQCIIKFGIEFTINKLNDAS